MAGEEARWQLHKNVEQYWITPQSTNYTITCLPSRKLSKLDEPDTQDTAGETDELISDVLLWTPTYGRAKAGRPARTYLQQLCEDMGCSPEDLPEAMNNRKSDERGSGISVLAAWHDEIYINFFFFFFFKYTSGILRYCKRKYLVSY